MTLVNPPLWVESGEYSAELDRIALAYLGETRLTASGVATAQGVGLLGDTTSLKITAVGGTSLGFTVAAGAVLVPVPVTSTVGSYLCYNDDTVTLAVTAATGSPRIDLVYAYATDEDYGDGTSAWVVGIIQGSPSGTPLAPTAPTNASVELAYILVKPASQNGGVNKISAADITDRRLWANHGVKRYTKTTMRTPLVGPGDLAYDITAKQLQVGDGTSLRAVTKLAGLAAAKPLTASAASVPLRPGDEYYETDTGYEMVWDGVGWTYRSGQMLYSLQGYGDAGGHTYVAALTVVGSRTGGTRAAFNFPMPRLRPQQKLVVKCWGRIYADHHTLNDLAVFRISSANGQSFYGTESCETLTGVRGAEYNPSFAVEGAWNHASYGWAAGTALQFTLSAQCYSGIMNITKTFTWMTATVT